MTKQSSISLGYSAFNYPRGIEILTCLDSTESKIDKVWLLRTNLAGSLGGWGKLIS